MKKINDVKTSELAKLLNVTPCFISHVKHGRNKFSAKQSLKINKEFGIPLYEIRPDVYPKELFPQVN